VFCSSESTLPKKHAEVTHKISAQGCGYLPYILIKRLISISNTGLLIKRRSRPFTALSIVLTTGNACALSTRHAQHLPQSMAPDMHGDVVTIA